MKKILLILAHPNKDSLSAKLLDFYYNTAKEKGREVRRIFLGDINFDLNLAKGYKEIQELEPDLKKAQEDIIWADHLVFAFPIWWYSFPALLKGFIDRVFLPGFAFKYKDKSPIPDKLLKGKTADIICTSGAPKINYFLNNGNIGPKLLKNILKFCGIKTKNKILIGSVVGEVPDIKLEGYKKMIKKII